MKILMIAPKTSTFINFRLDLVKQILNKGHEVIVISSDEDKTKCLETLGIKLIKLSLNKTSLNIFSNLKYLIDLTQIIKKEKPDKVFSYTIKPVIFGSIAGKFAKVPEIYSMTTGLGYIYSANTLKFKILQFLCGIGYKTAFKFSKKVIFQNKDDAFEFSNKRKYLDISKCEIVNGSGVNMIEFPKCELPTSTTSFLMVSRMLSLKGIQEYFEAAKLVKKQYPDVKFVFVGSADNSPLSLDINKLYGDYIASGIVDFHKDCNNIKDFLENCSVFVLPSYYREGVPKSLLEALSIGRPIITTNNVGCKETINNGKNGFLIKPKNINDLVDKMIYFIQNPDKTIIMANESYNYCKSKFDVNLINNKMLEILNL